MALSITLVLPVVQIRMAEDLIKQAEENTLIPERIILIDNSKDGFYPESKIPTTRIRRKEPEMGVNESWNMGISLSTTDLVSIFNDDISITPYLFEKVEAVMLTLPKCGVACPKTITPGMLTSVFDDSIIKKERREPPITGIMRRREGWAFTIRKSVLDRIPKIPTELKTFFGDDWYWHHTQRLGFCWMRIRNTCVFHHVGVSVRAMGITKREGGVERIKFKRLIGG